MIDLKISKQIEEQIKMLPPQDLTYGPRIDRPGRETLISRLIEEAIAGIHPHAASRIREEFLGWGPLSSLLSDEQITEIILIGTQQIIFEKNGKLGSLSDQFCSRHTYHNLIDRICSEAKVHFNLERPTANGKFRDFRLHVISSELTHDLPVLSLRRHPQNPWTLEKLQSEDWCSTGQAQMIQDILTNRSNFLVIGSTGAGKTSLLNACLQAISDTERVVIIEDTPELQLPNIFSNKLVTRVDANGILPSIEQSELVRQSLRMRPDRLVMGEVRGAEAKDLLMALSTGHRGSFGSLHATDAAQALIRLEMLIQLGSPAWGLRAIRQLIRLSLEYLFVLEKSPGGQRRLQGIYKITSLEENGLLLERWC